MRWYSPWLAGATLGVALGVFLLASPESSRPARGAGSVYSLAIGLSASVTSSAESRPLRDSGRRTSTHPSRSEGRELVEARSLGGAIRFRLRPAPREGVLVGAVLDDGRIVGPFPAERSAGGQFLVRQLPVWTHAIVVAGGVTPFQVDAVRVALSQVTDLGTLRPPDAQPVAGRVVDARGAPLVGVQVTARSLEPTRPVHQVLRVPPSAVSDAKGGFCLQGLPAGRYRLSAVRARPPGIVRTTLVVPRAGFALPVTVRFQQPSSSRGGLRCDGHSRAR